MTAPAGAVTTPSGRYYQIQGGSYPSANTVLGVLDKPGLNVWKQKRVAVAIATDQYLRELVQDGQEWQAIRAALDTSSPEAELGTDVHWVIECWHKGEPMPPMVPEVRAHLDRYIELAEAFSIVPVHAERTVFHEHLHYAGTLDAAVRADVPELPEHDCTGVHVLDVKTGKRVYPDVALQLAGYARCTHLWDAATDELEPLEGICPAWGFVASVHAEVATLYALALAFAWPAFVAACDMLRWEEAKATQIHGPLAAPADVPPW